MPEKNVIFRKTIFVAFILFVIFSLSYIYIADIFLKAFDQKIGIQDIKIGNIDVSKGYDEIQNHPILSVTYTTTRKATSFIKVGDVASESSTGTNFSKMIALKSEDAGKNATLIFGITDDMGESYFVTQAIVIPQKIERKISIIN
jgi:hypothetical protein